MKSNHGIKKMSILFVMFFFSIFHAAEVKQSLADVFKLSMLNSLPKDIVQIKGMELGLEEKRIWYKKNIFNNSGLVTGLCLNESGQLITAGFDSDVKICDLEKQEIVSRLNHPGPIVALCLNSRGQLITGCLDNQLRIWNLEKEQIVSTLNHPDVISGLCLNKKGQLITSCHDGNARIWDFEKEQIVSTLNHPSSIIALCLNTKDQLITACSDGSTRIWNLENQQIVSVLNSEKSISVMCVNNNGQLIASCSDSNAIIWDFEKEETVATLNHPSPIIALCLNNSGQLMTGCSNGNIRIWDLESGRVIKVFKHSEGIYLNALCLNKDATQIAVPVGSTIHLWQLYQDWTISQLLLYNLMRTYLSVKKQNRSVVTTASSYFDDMASNLRLNVAELSTVWSTFDKKVQQSIWQKVVQVVRAYGH